MAARVSQIYSGKVKIKKCPKAHSMKRSFRSCFADLHHLTFLVIDCLQERERQFWFPTHLREGEQHRRKLRSDKYQPLVARLLEFYGS
jgi:hypothetical protein